MLRIVPHTVPRVGRSYEHFPDGFELHLLLNRGKLRLGSGSDAPDRPYRMFYAEGDGRADRPYGMTARLLESSRGWRLGA